jgi:hypothetical protein
MKKIAVFLEGQSEQIFVRELLRRTCDPNRISFECRQLRSDSMKKARFDYPNPIAEVHFLLVDVGSDEKVLSAVKEREAHLFRMGFERIIALRDMYSAEYHKRSPNVIDEAVIQDFVSGALTTISSMSAPQAIRVHFSVMELEAWLLAMYRLFERIDPKLTVDFIETELGFRLPDVDPQKLFYRPADVLDRIMQLAERSYRKSRGDVESICRRIDLDDISCATANSRCSLLKDFYADIRTCVG